jgi:site-specific recombinase XerD
MPTAVELLRRRREFQAEQQATAPLWETVTYEGETIHLVFTTPTGGLVLRQTVAKVIKQAAKTAGLDVEVATHTGRGTVVTTLYVEGARPSEQGSRRRGSESSGGFWERRWE